MPTEARESVVATNRSGAPLTIELSEGRWSVVYKLLRSTTPSEAHWGGVTTNSSGARSRDG
eukprot:4650487-Alexandrium_andersonii.AAC.1